jgi:hypothetical protein
MAKGVVNAEIVNVEVVSNGFAVSSAWRPLRSLISSVLLHYSRLHYSLFHYSP